MEDIEREIAGEDMPEDENIIMEPKHDDVEPSYDDVEPKHASVEESFDDVKKEEEDAEPKHDEVTPSHDDIEIVHEEDDFFDNEKEKRKLGGGTIKFNKRGSSSDKKRNIIVIILIALALILIAVIGYLFFIKKDNGTNKEQDKNKDTSEVIKEEEKEEEGKKVFYVSCDDNTSPLNVRNSASGDIIDGLTCFKEVEILEEAGSSDACDKWYRISYTKKGSSYTGYACGKYIKESKSDSVALKKMKSVIDKANKFYEDSQVMVYCGETTGTKTIQIPQDGHDFDGQYLKSEFKSLDELKKNVLTFMDESLIKVKLEVSDYKNPKMYDNYYEIDGNLYCRNYSGKGWMTYYTGSYDIEVVSETDNNVNLKIVYEYIDEDKLSEDSKCSVNNLSACSSSYFKYVIKNVTLSKDNGKYIVTKMDFHD